MLDVNVQVAINAVKAIDPRQNYVTLGMYYRSEWKDPRLTWKPADYAGLTYVRVLNQLAERVYVPPTNLV